MTLSQAYTVFEPSIWSPKINVEFKKRLVAAKYFDDYSDDVTEGGGTIYIPQLAEGAFTAADIKTSSGEVAATNLSDTKTSLTLTSWKGSAFVMSDYQKARIAKNYRLQEAYALGAGYSVAKKFDTDILALGSSITHGVGNSATDLLATSIEKAFAILESHSVPKEECVLFLHQNAYWGELMKIAKYYDASQFGKPSVPQGAHDLLYGAPVVITNQIPAGTAGTEGGHRNLLVHKRAFAYALASLEGVGQSGVRIQEKPSEHLRTRVIADIMYGVKCVGNYYGVRIISNT